MSGDAERIRAALRCGNAGCACAKGPNVHCTSHTDKVPSLTVHEGANGAVLVNCKTGCAQDAVIDSLKDLGLWPEHKATEAPARNGTAVHPVATYEYRDASGTLVAIKGRFKSGTIDPETKKPGKDFKWKLPGRETWGLDGTPISAFPLWGVELLAAQADERVYFVEGEKAALACRALGLLAVTHPGGASTTNFGESLEALRGRNVVLWPDSDDVGRKFMDKVRSGLRGISRSTVTIFPIVPDKGDAVEFFGSGNTVDGLLAQVPAPPRPVMEYLECEEDAGCRFGPEGLGYVATFQSCAIKLTIEHLRRSSGELRGEVLVQTSLPTLSKHLYWGSIILSSGANREKLAKTLEGRTKGLGIDWDGIVEVVCRKVAMAERHGDPFQTAGDMEGAPLASDWLITNFAPRLEPMTIWGDGGVGKSMLSLALGIGVKAGIEIVPGFSPVVSGSVLYLDWEASRQRLDTRVKRICKGAGINPVLIGYRRCAPALADQVEEVLRYCQSEGVVLVIIDSVEMAMNGTGGDNSNPNDKVILLHAALRLLNTTTVLIDHPNAVGRERKEGAGNPGGGVSKTNLARMAYELRRGTDPVAKGQSSLGLFNIKRNDDGPLFPAVGLKATFGEDWTRYERDGITDGNLVAGLSIRQRMISVLRENQPLVNKQLAEMVNSPQQTVNGILSRENGTTFTKLASGGWALCTRGEEPQDEIPF